jgi:hypothetical protein
MEDFLEEGKFVWVSTQEAPEFTDWGYGEPNDGINHNEDCAEIWFSTDAGQWNDAPCDNEQWAICEKA